MTRANRALAAALAVMLFVASGPAALADILEQTAPDAIAHSVSSAVDRAASDPGPGSAALRGSALALPLVSSAEPALAFGGLTRKKPAGEKASEPESGPLSAERAQVLLRSLTIPGWGQATLGHDRSATVFGLVELGVWATFIGFRVQVAMRRDAYERSAQLLAGIDLDGRDEEFRRTVGAFISSDEYNRLVVYRDAANLYYNDPALYRQYIAEHQLSGNDTWDWGSEENLQRYRAQRRNVTEASQNANTMLAVAMVNRLVSALHAARLAHGSKPGQSSPRSWNIEVAPSDPNDATAYRFAIHTRF
jgi:hypothetical protein